jgi:prolyl-tRNA synthetase
VELKGRNDAESENIPLAAIKAKAIAKVDAAKKLVS